MSEKKFAGLPDVSVGEIACTVHSNGKIDVFVKRGHETGSYGWVPVETFMNPTLTFPQDGDKRPILTIAVRPAAIVGVIDEREIGLLKGGLV